MLGRYLLRWASLYSGVRQSPLELLATIQTRASLPTTVQLNRLSSQGWKEITRKKNFYSYKGSAI